MSVLKKYLTASHTDNSDVKIQLICRVNWKIDHNGLIMPNMLSEKE